jgi:nitric oxide reductase NorD protein
VYPSPALHAAAPRREADDDADRAGPDAAQDASGKRRKAQREDRPNARNPLILPFRAESLLSFGEYVKVNRGLDDEPEANAGFADDMDELAIAPGGERAASQVKFDLDLPSEAVDDVPLRTGILLPEWDWKQRLLKPDQCCLSILEPRDARPCALPERLARPARKVRRQFEAIAPGRRWLRNQPDGSEADLDACLRALADRRAGHQGAELAAYLACERRERDLATLVLADLSMSTDAWVDNEARVIDVIRDSLMLFAEALAAIGERFALYGFSSRRREHIRFSRIKAFGERHGPDILGRIDALRPGYYTRMGAGIRQATTLLARQPAALRLLLILSDGKPNDLDHYEGRYGIEDTRMSLMAARQAGLKPFCVTIDREGAGYLPHLFGPDGFMVVRKPAELPLVLPRLYSRLTEL